MRSALFILLSAYFFLSATAHAQEFNADTLAIGGLKLQGNFESAKDFGSAKKFRENDTDKMCFMLQDGGTLVLSSNDENQTIDLIRLESAELHSVFADPDEKLGSIRPCGISNFSAHNISAPKELRIGLSRSQVIEEFGEPSMTFWQPDNRMFTMQYDETRTLPIEDCEEPEEAYGIDIYFDPQSRVIGFASWKTEPDCGNNE